jgi:hypothetical protein
MKKFLKNIAIFALVMVICDMCFGYAMDYVNSHAHGGGGAKRYYIIEKSGEDILMFGSSRMAHHYNPQMIADSLGLSCYNCGEDGNGIIYSYGLFQHILKRYTPKVIIYDISSFDVKFDDLSKYIGLLRPYADDPDVANVITTVSPNDRLKLYSHLYRYNSTCIGLLGGMVGSSRYEGGFEPLNAVMDYEPEIPKDENNTNIEPFKEQCLRNLIQTCQSKKIKLIFTVSPSYHGEQSGPAHPEVKALCDAYGITFIDCLGLHGVSDNREFFKDRTHLNVDGANAFTDSLITRIKPIVCTQ